MEYIYEFFIVATVHLLGVMSPGPDFVMTVRNSMHSRHAGIYTAIGLGLGVSVHIVLSLCGVGILIAQSWLLLSFIKYVGALYLIYLGVKMLHSKPTGVVRIDANKTEMQSRGGYVWIGFLTNVTNPKAVLFFLTIFLVVIDQHTPLLVQVVYSLEMIVGTFLWFALVSCLLNTHRIRSIFVRIQERLEKVFGVVMVALGVRVITTTD